MITWFLLGVAAGFPLWFSAGWVVRREEHRQLARPRSPRCAHGCPRARAATVTARAERVGEPAAAVKGGAR